MDLQSMLWSFGTIERLQTETGCGMTRTQIQAQREAAEGDKAALTRAPEEEAASFREI